MISRMAKNRGCAPDPCASCATTAAYDQVAELKASEKGNQ